jgi:hypothetical protein
MSARLVVRTLATAAFPFVCLNLHAHFVILGAELDKFSLRFLGAGVGFVASWFLSFNDVVSVRHNKFTIGNSFLCGGEFGFEGAGEVWTNRIKTCTNG